VCVCDFVWLCVWVGVSLCGERWRACVVGECLRVWYWRGRGVGVCVCASVWGVCVSVCVSVSVCACV
jgi:hypothetical protein